MHGLQKLLLLHVLMCLGRNVRGSVIIHGEKAPEGSMLYMASVQNFNSRHVCGGFLVSEDFVLTAAHCHDERLTHVVVGTHNLGNVNDGQKIKIEKKCRHPDYNDVSTGNDLMLLKLSNEVRVGNGVEIIQLPQRDMNLHEHQTCQVAGWGFVRTGGGSVSELRVTDVSVIDLKTCNDAWRRWIRLPANIICAGGSRTHKGFCQGDSGGPLACNGIAVGVVSFNRNYNCNYPDVPNVYTDVSKYRSWIQQNIDKKDC